MSGTIHDPWLGKPHTREQWAALRERGLARYLVTSPTTWIFLLAFGVASPIGLLLIAGLGAWRAALVNFALGTLMSLAISWALYRSCEAAWRKSGQP
ncbi:MAG: hypothetical protein JNM76_18700 [Betaproteobacteria bacterium]|nr:hypothetical protein [Betaproteobacteria bacterium]